jgi:anti-anti-sigma factor
MNRDGPAWTARWASGLATTSGLARRNIMPAPYSQPPIGAEDGKPRLQVTEETDAIVAISLEGEWDMASAPLLTAQTQRALADEKHLILDLSRATFIDSSTINALIKTHATASDRGQRLVLQLATAANVERILEVSGIDHLIPRVSSRSGAIQIIQELEKTDDGSA